MPDSKSDIVFYSLEELENYHLIRIKGLSDKSIRWLNTAKEVFWENTNGELSANSLSQLRNYTLDKFKSRDSWGKILNYAIAFLKHLSKIHFDQRYRQFEVYLEMPKSLKRVKLLTSRIITIEDIKNTLKAIDNANNLTCEQKLNYKGMILFLAYSGQRVMTGAQITVRQFKDALSSNPPVLKVEAEQDKIRMEHYAPLHPDIISIIQDLIKKKHDNDVAFDYNGLMRWLRENPVKLTRISGKLELKDLRKAFEQISDEIGFIDANKNFIMSHGVSSINWKSYKQFLPENVYARYIKFWKDVDLIN